MRQQRITRLPNRINDHANAATLLVRGVAAFGYRHGRASDRVGRSSVTVDVFPPLCEASGLTPASVPDEGVPPPDTLACLTPGPLPGGQPQPSGSCQIQRYNIIANLTLGCRSAATATPRTTPPEPQRWGAAVSGHPAGRAAALPAARPGRGAS